MNTVHATIISGPVVGVKTTRIYCWPHCRPGRAPRPENCVPFPDAASARAAGYRGCKQCRPDETSKLPTRVGYGIAATSIGFLFVARTDVGVCALYVLDTDDARPGLDRLLRDVPGARPEADLAVAAAIAPLVLEHIETGRPCSEVPLDLRGTPFQLRVWAALCAIPRGTTTSYGAVARAIGLPRGAARAVGTACGANPVSLIVPCHRVVRACGGLGGYGWGLERKRVLLDLEAVPGPELASV